MNNGLFRACDNRAGHCALLLAVGAALFLLNLGGATLWDLDEGRNATASGIMLESGNYIIPYFNGELRVDKPALLYWLQIGAYKLFGVSEFSARLPSALAALLTILLCYELGRRLFTPATGLIAGLVLASTPMLCGAARFANPDSLLNCLTVLSLYFFWRGLPAPNWFWFVSMGAASGLAVLAKGPVGVVLPMAVIGLFLWQPLPNTDWANRKTKRFYNPLQWMIKVWDWSLGNRRLRVFLDVRFFLGLLAFCLVAFPWYIMVALETKGDFLRGFFLIHNVQRALQTMEGHGGSVFFYPLVLGIGFAPWSIFLLLAFWYGLWSMVKKPWSRLSGVWSGAADTLPPPTDSSPLTPRHSPLGYRFLLCWIGVYLLFFSLAATKLPNYILPIAVPTALLIGRFLERWRQGLVQPPRWMIHVGLWGIATIALCISIGLLFAGGAVRLEFMHDHYVQGMQWWAIMGLVPLLGMFLAWRRLRKQDRTGVITWIAASIIAFFVPMAAWATATLNRHKPSRPLVEQAGALIRDREIRIGCWQLEHLPSLNFYCQRDVFHLQTEQEVLNFLRYPTWQRVFLFVPEKQWQAMAKNVHTPYRILARHRDLYRACDVVVVSNSW
jgi:4-amino-4-deoxy-L-arabinose transferase-like glycosyltransferase